MLIIDDEEIIRRGLEAIIKRSEVKCSKIYTAADGWEGLELIIKYQPDIVITDIKMPHLDGLELIARVQKISLKRPVFIIISGYDDFNYAKQAIKYGVKEYLLKPIDKEEMIQLLHNISLELDDNIQRHEAELVKNMQSKVGMELLKEKYFNQLIQGDIYDEKTFRKQLSSLGVVFNSNLFRILVIEYCIQNQESPKVLDEMDRFALKDAVDDGISVITKEFWSFYDTSLRLVILLCNADNFLIENHIKKIYEQINKYLSVYIKVDTFLGVGNGVTGLDSIQHSYEEALNMALYKVIRQPGEILFSKGMDDINENPNYHNNFTRLASEVELCMKNNVAKLLDEFFHQMQFDQGSISKLSTFYNEFNQYMYDYFTEKGIDFTVVFEPGTDDFRELDSFWDLEQIKEYLNGYLLKICNIISAYRATSPDRKIIEQVIRYIRDNYDKDINLNIVANLFHKNNSYLSVLFKKETGQNFIDYLTMIRIEKAKELLAQNRLKIVDVSNKVGYPNAKHFCMVFKKVVGLSPTQYREGCFNTASIRTVLDSQP